MREYPRTGDAVFQQSREDHEEWPHGKIISIDRDYGFPDNNEILVLFKRPVTTRRTEGTHVLVYNDDILWDARKPDFKVNSFQYEWTGDEYSWGGETEIKSFRQYDFEGNWSTSQGGNARWEII
jgi:hypothetical protein